MRKMEMPPAHPTQHQSFETLDVQVKGLEIDVRDLKDSVLGLNVKFDQAMASISHEVRSAIAGLSNQFTERLRTPWGILIPGAGFIVLVLGLYGSQAISPINADVKKLQAEIVPRDEINYRSAIATQRFESLTAQINQIQILRYEELVKTIERLSSENGALRTQTIADRDARISGGIRRVERLENDRVPRAPRSPILGDEK